MQVLVRVAHARSVQEQRVIEHRAVVVRVRTEFFFFQAEDGIRGDLVTGVQTCALPISGSADSPRSRSWTSGALMARMTSSWSFFTIGAGVAAGRNKPLNSPTSTPGTPASAIVGTSGISVLRLAEVTASARTWPDLIGPATAGESPMVNRTSPEITAVMESVVLL